jgi:hypothetical protein
MLHFRLAPKVAETGYAYGTMYATGWPGVAGGRSP